MIVYLRTMSVQAVTGIYLTFDYNSRLYAIEKNIIRCAMLVPGIEYTFETKVTCLQPESGACIACFMRKP